MIVQSRVFAARVALPGNERAADVSGGGEEEDGCHYEAHCSWGVLVGVVDGPDAERGDGGSSPDAGE
jgi:hypothetical protein